MKRRVLGLFLALFGAACADGYPSDDEPLMLHYGMSQEEALQTMNQIGSQNHLRYHWRYELQPGCVLRVRANHLFARPEPLAVSLAGSEAIVSKANANNTFDVGVRTGGRQADPHVSVLEGVDRMDAFQMQWLLQYAQRDCLTSEPSSQ